MNDLPEILTNLMDIPDVDSNEATLPAFERKVLVTADEHGRVVIPTSNPEYAYIKIQQFAEDFDENGWLQIRRRTALLKGPTKRLDSFRWKRGQTLPGRIVVREQLTPFNEDQAEREIKYAGMTGVVCRVNDQPIYRKTFWDRTGTKEDILIPHTNIDEIKAAIVMMKKVRANLVPQLGT